MTEPIMKKAKGDGVQINLASWQGNAGPILCVHGITANCRCWDVLAEALIPDYRVIANRFLPETGKLSEKVLGPMGKRIPHSANST